MRTFISVDPRYARRCHGCGILRYLSCSFYISVHKYKEIHIRIFNMDVLTHNRKGPHGALGRGHRYFTVRFSTLYSPAKAERQRIRIWPSN